MTINIYYCWFGGGEYPQYLKQNLATWKQHMPQANIIEINEKNFDVSWCKYSEQAYQQGKFAFVSDVARLYYLYHYGGIYLDTDVRMTKSLEEFIFRKKLQLSLEWYDDELTGVNTGTIICRERDDIIYQVLQYYRQSNFEDKGLQTLTINQRFNKLLLTQEGLQDKKYDLSKVVIYPSSYFCRQIDASNYTIHDYQTTWRHQRKGWLALRHQLGKSVKRLVGPSVFNRLWHRRE